MKELESIDGLLQRCYCIKGQTEFLTKMYVMELMGHIHRMVEKFKIQIEQLIVRPVMNTSTRKCYEDCSRRISDCISCFTIQPPCDSTADGSNQSITDWFFFNWKDKAYREEAEQMKSAVDVILSKVPKRVESWTAAVKNALGELLACIERIADLVDSHWTKQQYELLMDELGREYVNAISPKGESAKDFYARWKRDCYDEADEYPNLLSTIVEYLLDSGFIIVDNFHLGCSYKQNKEEWSFYVTEEETTVEWQKKFATLCKIVGYKEHRFLFCKSALGKYIFKHRSSLSDDDLKAFFFFKQVCQLAYADMDGTNDDAEKQGQNKINSIKDDIDFSTLKSRFSEEEVKSSGIKKHADIVLAVMDTMKEDVPKVYWFGFYCVLLEKDWIDKSISGFCSRMSNIFDIDIDRSALNEEKNNNGIDIDKWIEVSKRTKGKKDFALRFRKYIDFYLDYRRQYIIREFS